MDGTVTTIRELSIQETQLVGGAWTWSGLGASMLTGAIVGGLSASATGAGIPAGAFGGALLGGAGYLINDMLVACF